MPKPPISRLIIYQTENGQPPLEVETVWFS